MSLQVKVGLSTFRSSTQSSDTQVGLASPKKILCSPHEIIEMSNRGSLEIKEVSLKGNQAYGSVFKLFSSCTHLKNYEKLYTPDVFLSLQVLSSIFFF